MAAVVVGVPLLLVGEPLQTQVREETMPGTLVYPRLRPLHEV